MGKIIIAVPLREMKVYEAEEFTIAINRDSRQLAVGRMVITVRFFVSSGTYIRSLSEELGRRLGYPATLLSLRRTKIGKFDVQDAKKIKDF